MKPTEQSKLRLQLLGVLFVSVVCCVVVYSHQLIIPLFLGILTWGKAWLKNLTPKLGLLFLKNGIFIQIRRILVKASTHIFVQSHRPWRRWITTTRIAIAASIKHWFARYMQLALWLRTGIALLVLLATAGSSFAVFALLIIPQPVLNWLRKQLMSTLNKLGVSQFFSALWKFIVPDRFRHQWYMHVKWTIGRRQVQAAKKVHEQVFRRGKNTQRSDG